MHDIRWEALGTAWSITTDGEELREVVRQEIFAYIEEFDQRFSRFILSSEANAFRNAVPGSYAISPELAEMLCDARKLFELSGGAFDPAVGKLMEALGYDVEYRMRPHEDSVSVFEAPKWSLEGQVLTVSGPIVFDIGGIGKGYCIDKVADLLKEADVAHFLVDGGGDMYATAKKDGSPWRVAVQYPGKPDMAAGVVRLSYQGFAVSDVYRRSWGRWHHILDSKRKKPIAHVVGAAAIAPSAFAADCMTSALFCAPQNTYEQAAAHYRTAYLVFEEGGGARMNRAWREVSA